MSPLAGHGTRLDGGRICRAARALHILKRGHGKARVKTPRQPSAAGLFLCHKPPRKLAFGGAYHKINTDTIGSLREPLREGSDKR